MSDPAMQPIAAETQLCGYTLKERIGSGGYGDVWSAVAPGGMRKAVKIIYGYHDENRAQRELKSLNRVREVRHPFLLSLERIEIYDGRLVIVSELAEGSLKERFQQVQEQGLVGIDRDELLLYMTEAADALDYLADRHTLAHLDIKPENLLLVGGHVKVADFGLVKEIVDANQSLMDGLTPAYAAPELFDGRPGRFSDQYSLAIVYQEMLTGTRPFSGTTPAQLASQHLKSSPNLNQLPRSDQAVISRALSKQPEKRYNDCRSMLNELSARRSRCRGTSLRPPQQSPSVSTNQVTESSPIQPVQPDQSVTLSQFKVPGLTSQATVVKAAPIQLEDSSSAKVRPTLFIGVGGTAAKTLCHLKKKICSRYGSAADMPAMRMLCIDVDRRSLFEATMGSEDETLQTSETLEIPLRKPEEYRSDSQLDTSWIGRRWIYNIPKSRLTESLRPLGRLAYIDHHEEIYRRIHDELEKLQEVERLAKTAETLQLNPHDAIPQVFIVTSIAGGIGSGMGLDLAYTVRTAMGELGLHNEHLFGVLAHSTSRHKGDSRLNITNTYAFLTEFYHYNLHGYSASPGCRLPDFDSDTPVFDGTYVAHLGEDLTEAQYEAGIEGLANYLYLSTATRCTDYFETLRNTDSRDPSMVRSFGIHATGSGSQAMSDTPTRELSQQLLQQWLRGPARSTAANSSEEAELPIASQLEEVSGLFEHFPKTCYEWLQSDLAPEPIAFLLQEFSRHIDPASVRLEELWSQAEQFVDRRIGKIGSRQLITAPSQKTLSDFMDARVKSLAKKTADGLTTMLYSLVDRQEARLHGAQSASEQVAKQFEHQLAAGEQQREQISQNIKETQAHFHSLLETRHKQEVSMPDMQNVLETLFEQKLETLRSTLQCRLSSLVLHQIQGLQKKLNEYTQKLDLVNQQLTYNLESERAAISLAESDDLTEDVEDINSILTRQMVEHIPSLVPLLDDVLQATYLAENEGLLNLLQQETRELRGLPEYIHREGSRLVNQRLETLSLDDIWGEFYDDESKAAKWLRQFAECSQPRLWNCGGTSNLLLACPQRSPAALLSSAMQEELMQEANTISSTCGDFIVCYEMANMLVENIAMNIMQMRPDCAELVQRLYSRNDVAWTRLTPLC